MNLVTPNAVPSAPPVELRKDRRALAALWSRDEVLRLLNDRIPDFATGRLALESVDRGAIRFLDDRLEATYQLRVRERREAGRHDVRRRFARILLDQEPSPHGGKADFMLSPEDPRFPPGILDGDGPLDFLSGLASLDARSARRDIVSHRFGSRIVWRFSPGGPVVSDAGGTRGDLAVKLSRRPPMPLRMEWDPDARTRLEPLLPLGTMEVDRAFLSVTRWTEATSLHARLSGSSWETIPFRDIGRALAFFHASARSDSTREERSLAGEIGQLKRLVDRTDSLFENVGGFVRPAIERLERDADNAGAEPDRPGTWIHGDLHDKQILLDGRKVLLIDLDSVARGNPALDPGNLAAHLVLRGLQGGVDREKVRGSVRLVIGGYRSAGGDAVPEVLSLYTRAALIRLAMIYLLRMEWAGLFHGLLLEERQIGDV